MLVFCFWYNAFFCAVNLGFYAHNSLNLAVGILNGFAVLFMFWLLITR